MPFSRGAGGAWGVLIATVVATVAGAQVVTQHLVVEDEGCTAAGSSAEESVEVVCPDLMVATGGGFEADPGVEVLASRPAISKGAGRYSAPGTKLPPSPTGWEVRFEGSGCVRVHAVCAPGVFLGAAEACPSGKYGQPGACDPCPAGRFGGGTDSCVTCEDAGLVTCADESCAASPEGCEAGCPPGKYGQGGGVCVRCETAGLVTCPDRTCAPSAEECGATPCPGGRYGAPGGVCVDCEDSALVTCANGACAPSAELCATPGRFGLVLCPDGRAVSSLAECLAAE